MTPVSGRNTTNQEADAMASDETGEAVLRIRSHNDCGAALVGRECDCPPERVYVAVDLLLSGRFVVDAADNGEPLVLDLSTDPATVIG